MKLPKLNQYHGNLNNIKSYNIQVLLIIQNIAGIQPAEELDCGPSFTSSICDCHQTLFKVKNKGCRVTLFFVPDSVVDL